MSATNAELTQALMDQEQRMLQFQAAMAQATVDAEARTQQQVAAIEARAQQQAAEAETRAQQLTAAAETRAQQLIAAAEAREQQHTDIITGLVRQMASLSAANIQGHADRIKLDHVPVFDGTPTALSTFVRGLESYFQLAASPPARP